MNMSEHTYVFSLYFVFIIQYENKTMPTICLCHNATYTQVLLTASLNIKLIYATRVWSWIWKRMEGCLSMRCKTFQSATLLFVTPNKIDPAVSQYLLKILAKDVGSKKIEGVSVRCNRDKLSRNNSVPIFTTFWKIVLLSIGILR